MKTTVNETASVPAVDIQAPDAKYQALAKRLGVTMPATPSKELLQHVLSALSINVYDLTAVRNYMISKKPGRNMMFRWVRLTAKTEMSRALMSRFPLSNDWKNLHGGISSGVYSKPVPYPVLLTVDAITKEAAKLGFKPSFYISDYAEGEEIINRRADPFLAVGTSNSDALFVIERWDEPGFREEVYSSKKKAAKTATHKTK